MDMGYKLRQSGNRPSNLGKILKLISVIMKQMKASGYKTKWYLINICKYNPAKIIKSLLKSMGFKIGKVMCQTDSFLRILN